MIMATILSGEASVAVDSFLFFLFSVFWVSLFLRQGGGGTPITESW